MKFTFIGHTTKWGWWFALAAGLFLPQCTCESTKPLAESQSPAASSSAMAIGDQARANASTPASPPAKADSAPSASVPTDAALAAISAPSPLGPDIAAKATGIEITEAQVKERVEALTAGTGLDPHGPLAGELRRNAIAALSRSALVNWLIQKHKVPMDPDPDTAELKTRRAGQCGLSPDSWVQRYGIKEAALVREAALLSWLATKPGAATTPDQRLEEALEDARLGTNWIAAP